MWYKNPLLMPNRGTAQFQCCVRPFVKINWWALQSPLRLLYWSFYQYHQRDRPRLIQCTQHLYFRRSVSAAALPLSPLLPSYIGPLPPCKPSKDGVVNFTDDFNHVNKNFAKIINFDRFDEICVRSFRSPLSQGHTPIILCRESVHACVDWSQITIPIEGS